MKAAKRIKPKNGKVMSFYAVEATRKILAGQKSKSAAINRLIINGHYAELEMNKTGEINGKE
jgi:hypothetical protein